MARATRVGQTGKKATAIMAALRELGQATARELGRKARVDTNHVGDILKKQSGVVNVNGVWHLESTDTMTANDFIVGQLAQGG